VPLASTFMLSTKPGLEAYVDPVVSGSSYQFNVKVGKPANTLLTRRGTKSASSGSSFLCLVSGAPIPFEYVRNEAKAGRMGARLMAVAAEGDRGRVFFSPSSILEKEMDRELEWSPDLSIESGMSERVVSYGFLNFSDLFTKRQLVALTTFSDLVAEARSRIKNDTNESQLIRPHQNSNGLVGDIDYADAVAVYLGLGVSKSADYWSSMCTWRSDPKNLGIGHVFSKQSIPMTWDYAEGNPFSSSSGNYLVSLDWIARVIKELPTNKSGVAIQSDAGRQTLTAGKVVSTDPPYYDNIGYADLSDFFYVWLRSTIRPIYSELFSTLAVPKLEELVATPNRHGGKAKAQTFFLDGMTQAMHRLAEQAHPAFPVSIYYAFKQSENDGLDGTTNTGWDTFLAAVIEAGFTITGTWPMRTEMSNRMVSFGNNALASSIVLICRKRTANAQTVTRREFIVALKEELPQALAHLQAGNIAPVDLAQAAIGPGMAVYTRYAKVIDAEGNPLQVRAALSLINQTLDEALADQEGDFDADTRWALTWFDQVGFAEGDYGVAEQLSKSKNTAVAGLVEGGILLSKSGKVRLLKPSELSEAWDPATDKRLTVWEMVHHLVRALESNGEGAASILVSKLGSKAETARELCYRLFTLCERRKRATEAMSYNGLVQSWPEITRLASEQLSAVKVGTTDMFEKE